MASVLELIEQKAEQSNGKCGISIITLQEETQQTFAQLKTELLALKKARKIKIRPGINHKLIFKS